jgi:hypothetical protein
MLSVTYFLSGKLTQESLALKCFSHSLEKKGKLNNMHPFQKTVEVVEMVKDTLETAVYDAFYYLTKPKYPIKVVKALEFVTTIPVKIVQTEQIFKLEMGAALLKSRPCKYWIEPDRASPNMLLHIRR